MIRRSHRPHVASALLVFTAFAFTLTASAYTAMAYRKLDAEAAAASPQGNSGLLDFLDRHGAKLMAAELAALALAAIAAMTLDRRRTTPQGTAADSLPQQDPNSRQSGVP